MAFALRKPPKLDPRHNAYPYQLDALRAVEDLPYAAIFHEQGLGKTKIAIDLVLHWLGADIVDTVFVITKKSLVNNWCEEIKTHSFITPRILSENRRQNSAALNSPVILYVLNYEVISANLDIIKLFLRTCRVGAILDESQKIKNPEAKLTQEFLEIAECFSRRVIMTGTPVANRPYDIWSQIKFLDGGSALGNSFEEFKAKTDLPNTISPQKDLSKDLAKVMNLLSDFAVRETKETSGIELPAKVITNYVVEMGSAQNIIYRKYRDDLCSDVVINGKARLDSAGNILKLLMRLVQCASNPLMVDESYSECPAKFNKLRDILDEAAEANEKAIVWTSFIKNAEWLTHQLARFEPVRVHGNMTIDDRNAAIQNFKTNSSCMVLVATPGAAKEGLTLTVANHSIFFDRSFSLDDYLQAQDRIHRISQTKKCLVHNLIAKDSVDEWVDSLLNAKYQAAQLTQGDIKQSEFSESFNYNLDDLLSEVLESRINDKTLMEAQNE